MKRLTLYFTLLILVASCGSDNSKTYLHFSTDDDFSYGDVEVWEFEGDSVSIFEANQNERPKFRYRDWDTLLAIEKRGYFPIRKVGDDTLFIRSKFRNESRETSVLININRIPKTVGFKSGLSRTYSQKDGFNFSIVSDNLALVSGDRGAEAKRTISQFHERYFIGPYLIKRVSKEGIEFVDPSGAREPVHMDVVKNDF